MLQVDELFGRYLLHDEALLGQREHLVVGVIESWRAILEQDVDGRVGALELLADLQHDISTEALLAPQFEHLHELADLLVALGW